MSQNKIPIDYNDVAKQTGCTQGKLCKHSAFGWGVFGNGDADFCCYVPPKGAAAIEDGYWIIEEEE